MNALVDVSFFPRAAKPLTSYRKFWAARFGTAPFLPMSRAEMGMMADKYVSRAPSRYKGSREPGTLVMAQLASGAQFPSSAEAERRFLRVLSDAAVNR